MTDDGMMGRRRAALFPAAMLAGCAEAGAGRAARAQGSGPAPSNVVLPVPVPCGSQPDDIVGLLLEGPSEATVVVFGQAFRPGDLPQGAGLLARFANGGQVPAQFDLKVRHADRSARHGLVSLSVPALARGERRGVILSRAADGGSGPLDVAGAIAGRQAVLEVRPLAGGDPWRADLLALWQATRAAAPWQSGPLAVQDRVAVPVPPAAVGGVASMRLVADMAVRADGTLCADIWLRNDIAMQANGGDAAYAVRLEMDGQAVLAEELPRQFQYQAFGRVRGVRRGGQAVPVAPFVRHDMNYLADTASIPRYDQSTGVEVRALDQLVRQMAEPTWNQPLDGRGVTRAMGSGGGRADIGPVTGWQAQWLCSGDRRAAAFCLGQAEAAGAIPWHFWDAANGVWLNTDHYPRLWTDGRGGTGRVGDGSSGGLTQQVSGATGWGPDNSHQPDLCFVPYLLTGRQALLDEVLAQSARCIMGFWPAPRLAGRAIVVNGGQVRGAAWAMRQIENSAWLAADGTADQRHIREVADRNWKWLVAQLPAWTEMQGEVHGWLPGDYGVAGAIPPWQQDYLASTVTLAARRGNADARAFLRWASNFLVGRFFAEESGFARQDGTAYLISISPAEAPRGPPLRSWRQIAAVTREKGMSNDGTWRTSRGDYNRWALQTLAQIAETMDDARAREAYAWLSTAGAPFTAPQDHARLAQLNIVPRGAPRVAGRPTTCR